MKKLFHLALACCLGFSLFAVEPSWQKAAGVEVKGDCAKIASGNRPLLDSFYHLKTWQVAPGVNYHFSVDVAGEVKLGRISLLLHIYNGYDGTETSVKTMKEISLISAGKIKKQKIDGKRTVLCTFTAPANATGVRFQVIPRSFKGNVTFDNLLLEQADNTLVIPWLDKLPALDGKWHPEFAAKALTLHDFMTTPVRDDKLDDEQTTGAVAMSNTHFYAEFQLRQKKVVPWVTNGLPRDDHRMWRDDSIELFLTHVGGQKPVYQFIVTVAGGFFDSSNENPKWNSEATWKAVRKNDGTAVIQLLIPLKDLGYIPGTDDNIIKPFWRFNVRRNHAKCAARIHERQSTLAPVAGMHDFDRYLRILRKRTKTGTAYSTLFNSESAYVAHERPQRFWRPAHPQYKELLSNRKPPLSGEGNILWYHSFDPALMPFALQYGIPWSHEEIGKVFRDSHMHMFGVYDIMADWAESCTKTPGCGAVLHGPVWVRDWSMNHSEAARKEFIETMRKSIKERPGRYWAVTLGDEVVFRLRNVYMRRAADEHYIKAFPEFKAMMETIKRDYGFGKYTIPKGKPEGEPFGTLALNRYLCDKALEFEKDIRKMLDEHEKETGEKILLMSHDPIGYTPDEYSSRSTGICDLYSLQNGPVHHPQRQQIAFLTQMIRDLVSPRPVWPCVHTESYLGVYTPEEVYAAISEAVRGGATGLHIFNRDTRGRVAKTGDTFLDYYGHRPRWEATLEAARTLENMPALKFPKASLGLFFSTDFQFSEPAYNVIPPEMAYNLAGPGAGAYLRIFDDIQVEDGVVSLSQWPIVLLPDAKIERINVSRKFREYVNNGGTVICTDPEVFSFHIDGTDTTRFREELFGARSVAGKRSSPLVLALNEPFLKGQKAKELPLSASDYHLVPAAGTRVLARFKDGAAAITLKEYPKGGKAILFAFSLEKLEPQQNQAPWHDFYRQIFKNYSIPTDLPIWNFELPIPEKYLAPKPVMPTRQCLTGNNFFWFENVPQKVGNAVLPGAKYILSLAPDSDKAGRREFGFAEGNLTNRLAALQSPDLCNAENMPLIRKGTLRLNQFVDVWTKTDAFEIRFRFPTAVTVEKLRIVFANTLPDYQVSCDGGKTFTSGKSKKSNLISDEIVKIYMTGTANAHDNEVMLHSMGDVGEAVLDIPAQTTKEVILRLGKRPDGERMILSEIEIWGKKN